MVALAIDRQRAAIPHSKLAGKGFRDRDAAFREDALHLPIRIAADEGEIVAVSPLHHRQPGGLLGAG